MNKGKLANLLYDEIKGAVELPIEVTPTSVKRLELETMQELYAAVQNPPKSKRTKIKRPVCPITQSNPRPGPLVLREYKARAASYIKAKFRIENIDELSASPSVLEAFIKKMESSYS